MALKKILLVEGKDDKHVIINLCAERCVPDFTIQAMEGIERLLTSFPTQLEGSDIGVLGVVVDADTDLSARWHSLRDRLVEKGYQHVPDEPDPTGAILCPPRDSLLPRVGVWIMPDNQTNGTLEDFLRFLVPDGSRLFEHVESSVDSIPADERRFKDAAKPKALIHTWLAWQEEPGKPLGQAITARYLDSGVSQVNTLVAWLNRLFFP